MKMRPLILSLLLLNLAALPLRAQWSGSADLSAGVGGMMGNRDLDVGLLGHVVTNGNATFRYQAEKFTWTTFESADGEECWVDVARGNRRLFLLGIRWHF